MVCNLQSTLRNTPMHLAELAVQLLQAYSAGKKVRPSHQDGRHSQPDSADIGKAAGFKLYQLLTLLVRRGL
jgi:hypothetical protein